MKKNTFSSFHLLCFLILICMSTAFPQHITATYSTTAPEAGLFFLDPGYINPAVGNGVLGMMANPAGLYHVKSRQVSIAYTAPFVSSGNFDMTFVDQSEIYDPFDLNTQMQVEELGGLAGLGFAQRMNRWTFGLSVQQPRRGGLRFRAGGSVDVSTAFDFEKAITQESFADLPVDELPITWDVDTQATLGFSSAPADLYVSILPIMAGASFSSKHFSVGAGLTYYRLSSSNETGRFDTQLNIHSTITGTPIGMNPLTNQPWEGRLQGDVDFQDNPVTALYKFDVSGHRMAFTLGGMMNYKLLSIGASYSNGGRATIKGSYDIQTITTVGMPLESVYSDVDLTFTDSQINGNVSLNLHEFEKDTLNSFDSGDIQVGGYHSISVGAQFLFLGAFVGTQIPKTYPDLMNAHFGVYGKFKIPMLPIRLNAGFIQCIDSVAGSLESSVPYRITTHVGGGVAFALPVTKWLNIGEQSATVGIGVRSSLTSYAMDIFESEAQNAQEESLPSPLENLTISMGLDLPF